MIGRFRATRIISAFPLVKGWPGKTNSRPNNILAVGLSPKGGILMA